MSSSKRARASAPAAAPVEKLPGCEITPLAFTGVPAPQCSLGYLSEEIVVSVWVHLITVPSTSRRGLALAEARALTITAATSLWATCKWMHSITRSQGFEVWHEVHCRMACPRALCWTEEFPFTAQKRRELTSLQELGNLHAAMKHLTLHCASTHCQRARRGFNEQLKVHGRLRVAYDLCKRMVAARMAPVAAIYTHGFSSATSRRSDAVVIVQAGEQARSLVWNSNSELKVCLRVSVVDEEVLGLSISPMGDTVVAMLSPCDVLVVRVESGEVHRLIVPPAAGVPRLTAAWPHSHSSAAPGPELMSMLLVDDAGERILTWAADADDHAVAPYPLRFIHESVPGHEPACVVRPSEDGATLLAVRRLSATIAPDDVSRIELLTIDASEEIVLVDAAIAGVFDVCMLPCENVVVAMAHAGSRGSLAVVYAQLSAQTWMKTQTVEIASAGPQQALSASPCGRFVVTGDVHTTPAACSILDLRAASQTSGVTVTTQTIVNEAAPRFPLGWGEGGIWVLTQRGVVLLES
jgi:hypothetical protein